MTITIQTYNQILGNLVRKLLPDTPLNDINNGSVLLTLLEAVATSDFDNNTAVLSLLELLNIDALRNNDLDARAADYGLTRFIAQRASGVVTITDSSFTKRSTGLYALKPAPITTSTKLYVNDASTWGATGNLYIGRGTQSFEGPIPYTSITNNGSFYTISLGTALKKDHLISDIVVDEQGKLDRRIASGTVVAIPANNQSAAIRYSVLRDAIIPAGEDTVTDVRILAQVAGSSGNAGIGTITLFETTPFVGATVTNTGALTDGRDVESDDDLRERLKSYANTLARGTSDSIISAILGISDSDENKQVQSAVIQEPPELGDPSILYIDDGRGFQPSYSGQSVDILLNSAVGNEEFLQLSNYPLPRPQVVNTADGPYLLTEGMTFSVYVDHREDSVTFTSSDFRNIVAATLPEIVIAINARATSFRCRLTEDSTRLLIYTTEPGAETLQVVALRDSDNAELWANSVFKFPVSEVSYISLYRNSELLRENQTSAVIITRPFDQWALSNTDGSLSIAVDGTPLQSHAFTSADFGGVAIGNTTVDMWVDAFNASYAGISATVTPTSSIQISSNRSGANSRLVITAGSDPLYFNQMIGVQNSTSRGQDSDFQLNRQTGNLRITSGISVGDTISAGSADTKGLVLSSMTTTGTFNMDVDSGNRAAAAVLVADSIPTTPRTRLNLTVGSTITISTAGSSVMRIMSSSLSALAPVQLHDYLYIAYRGAGWVAEADCGIFKVVAKGTHLSAGSNTYVDVINNNIVNGGPFTVASPDDIQVFASDAYPQVWSSDMLSTPATATIAEVVNSINDNIVNIQSTIFKTTAIKTTSTTETNGAFATPVSIGNAQQIFPAATEAQLGNQSHVAHRTFDKDGIAGFKSSQPINTTSVLGKWVSSDIFDALLENSDPLDPAVDPYSEILRSNVLSPSVASPDDTIYFHKGNNKKHYRSIKDIQASLRAGTQHNLPRTLFGHTTNDEITLMKPLTFSPDDNIVFIIDRNATDNTIVIPMSRTGRVNSLFPSSNQSFSAYDQDNEPGITFDYQPVWGKTITDTEFKDYAVWFRARNWYASGGVGSGGGSFLVRAAEFGPHGEKITFRLEHPMSANLDPTISYINYPHGTDVTMTFGSGAPRSVSISAGLQFGVTSLGSNVYRYTFMGPIDLSAVAVNDVIAIDSTAGVSTANSGAFRVVAKGLNYVDVYNPNGSATGAGVQEVTEITSIADVVGTAATHSITAIAEAAGGSAATYSFDAHAEPGPALDSFTCLSGSDLNPGPMLPGKYFWLHDETNRQIVFWYRIAGYYHTEPLVPGTDEFVMIDTVGNSDSAGDVATKTATAIEAHSKFLATAGGSIVSVVHAFDAVSSAGSMGDSGFTGYAFIAGVGGTTLASKYFQLVDVGGTLYTFWYYVDGSGTAPGLPNETVINTVTTRDSAATVASKTTAVIEAHALFTASITGITVYAQNVANGDTTYTNPGTAGTTSFTNFTSANGYGGTLSGAYFSIYDDVGKITFWYDINNTGTVPRPTVAATYRYVKIASIVAGDTAALVASKTTPYIDAELKFDAFVSGTTINVTNTFNGASQAAIMGTSGFTPYVFVAGTDDNSVDGKYFLIPDSAGTVAVWYNVTGTKAEPFHGANRSIMVATVFAGDSAATIATKTAVVLAGDTAWTTSAPIVATFHVIDASAGGRINGTAGTSGFTVATTTNGSAAGPETISLPTAFSIVPLANNTVQEIVDVINGSDLLIAVATSTPSLKINYATREDIYTPGSGYSVSLAYGHTPTTDHVNLYDSVSWVKVFQNVGPNFTLKTSLSLPGVSVAYDMGTAPNSDIADVGEIFKLIPVTLQNTYHQFTHKALSQLPIIADVSIANNIRSIQVKSKKLGSEGAVEIVGGRANAATLTLIGDAQEVIDSGNHFVEFKIPAAPFSINVGDYISVRNTNVTKRLSPIVDSDTIDVTASMPPFTATQYLYNPRVTLTGATTVAITDVSASYGRTTGYVWRWTFSAGDFSEVAVGNILNAYGTSWGANQSYVVGVDPSDPDYEPVTGYPVVGVDSGTRVVDIMNIGGVAMTSTAIGAGYVKIGPTPILKWRLKHVDGVTKYRVESLGFSDLFRIRCVSGDSPKFVSCGVAVDDIVVISGSTFQSANSGTFTVLGVAEDRIVVQNASGVEELDTVFNFNSTNSAVQWTAQSSELTGVITRFSNLTSGDWVKKAQDDDDLYVQVVDFFDAMGGLTTPTNAVRVTLGSVYRGTTESTAGVAQNGTTGLNAGQTLHHVNDIIVYNADSVRIGDQLFIDDIVDVDWFNIQNAGTFTVNKFDTSANYRPYVEISNSAAVTETARLMSVDPTAIYIIEGVGNETVLTKEVKYIAIDEFNPNRRVVYAVSPSMAYKMTQSNGAQISALGKLSYNTDIVTGIDGYLYYTGLLRKVQRIVDGFEPDATNYPGRRAVGGAIEILPPLIKRVTASLRIITNEGVNINEISSEIVSTVVKYINGLGVGQDVILSEITARVMTIRGVAAVTFVYPAPTNASIPIGDTEKPYIEPSDVSIA